MLENLLGTGVRRVGRVSCQGPLSVDGPERGTWAAGTQNRSVPSTPSPSSLESSDSDEPPSETRTSTLESNQGRSSISHSVKSFNIERRLQINQHSDTSLTSDSAPPVEADDDGGGRGSPCTRDVDPPLRPGSPRVDRPLFGFPNSGTLYPSGPSVRPVLFKSRLSFEVLGNGPSPHQDSVSKGDVCRPSY